jgi:D-ribose pyranase
MLKTGILNPAILSLLARVRHTNMLVIADRGFPHWPQIETIDLSLTDDIPTVRQVLQAVRTAATFGAAFMAEEFCSANSVETKNAFLHTLEGIPLAFEPHEATFKKRIPAAIGLIRTGDTTQYANIVLVSA